MDHRNDNSKIKQLKKEINNLEYQLERLKSQYLKDNSLVQERIKNYEDIIKGRGEDTYQYWKYDIEEQIKEQERLYNKYIKEKQRIEMSIKQKQDEIIKYNSQNNGKNNVNEDNNLKLSDSIEIYKDSYKNKILNKKNDINNNLQRNNLQRTGSDIYQNDYDDNNKLDNKSSNKGNQILQQNNSTSYDLEELIKDFQNSTKNDISTIRQNNIEQKNINIIDNVNKKKNVLRNKKKNKKNNTKVRKKI